MKNALRGINIGGWLVLEKWITPSLFADVNATDEWNLGRELGPNKMKKRLIAHRESFITESDIEWIAEHGFDVIRLPVGYWALADRDGFFNCKQFIDTLFEWARTYQLKVILDLHGVPGSQNGWDHSGRAGEMSWPSDPNNIVETLTFLRLLGTHYGSHPSLYAIEVLNEPRWDVPLSMLLGFYKEAYKAVREECGPDVQVIVSDSFRLDQISSGLVSLGITDVIIDSHYYQVFSEEDRNLSFDKHMVKVGFWQNEIEKYSRSLPIMVGEWSAALDPRTFKGKSAKEKEIMEKKYFNKQKEVFDESAVLWAYWTYKTEGKGPWSCRDSTDFSLK